MEKPQVIGKAKWAVGVFGVSGRPLDDRKGAAFPIYLIYIVIFVVALAWSVYCDYKGYTFYIGLTCYALGIVGAVAVAGFVARRGLAAIRVGSIVGFTIGFCAIMMFALVFWAPYNLCKWLQRRRGNQPAEPPLE